ncbi:MAG TPA: putative toxin-antitoxin system toxin component, PIN family [Euryarchaeota archaeon]|nr:hypothetical protein BMS3Bbin16_01225 [archaeon BMS3Bbin16]HDH28509.1 putative toxin-antitoxin system toxin component, PIN family [Euryarchaeota archaeon]
MTKPKVVPDTNIIISAIFWRGTPYEFMRSAIMGKCQLILSKPILSEVSDKLKTRFNVPKDKIEEYERILLANSKLVNPSTRIHTVKSDPSDDKILECAVEGIAEFIVTGDQHLLKIKVHSGVRIVNAKEMMTLL